MKLLPNYGNSYEVYSHCRGKNPFKNGPLKRLIEYFSELMNENKEARLYVQFCTLYLIFSPRRQQKLFFIDRDTK